MYTAPRGALDFDLGRGVWVKNGFFFGKNRGSSTELKYIRHFELKS